MKIPTIKTPTWITHMASIAYRKRRYRMASAFRTWPLGVAFLVSIPVMALMPTPPSRLHQARQVLGVVLVLLTWATEIHFDSKKLTLRHELFLERRRRKKGT